MWYDLLILGHNFSVSYKTGCFSAGWSTLLLLKTQSSKAQILIRVGCTKNVSVSLKTWYTGLACSPKPSCHTIHVPLPEISSGC